jgi:hypothetical protein
MMGVSAWIPAMVAGMICSLGAYFRLYPGVVAALILGVTYGPVDPGVGKSFSPGTASSNGPRPFPISSSFPCRLTASPGPSGQPEGTR